MDTAVKLHTVDEILALPEGQRAELIDGIIYDMGTPNSIHQKILSRLTLVFGNYISSHNGKCEYFQAPFSVFLNKDSYTYVEPDFSVICDTDKIDDRGCNGAPDFIAEVISLSSSKMDRLIKLFKYRSSGVREYWIIDPKFRTITVYHFAENEEDEDVNVYSFDEEVPVGIYGDLVIRLADYIE